MTAIRELPPRTTANGLHDAYCHVCWHPTYILWIEEDAPDHDRCPLGDYDALTCPNSLAMTNTAKLFADLRRKGLLDRLIEEGEE